MTFERVATKGKVEIGEIFQKTWGYDSLRVNFYEVVKITPKTVVLKRLQNAYDTPYMSNTPCGWTVPAKNCQPIRAEHRDFCYVDRERDEEIRAMAVEYIPRSGVHCDFHLRANGEGYYPWNGTKQQICCD